MVTKVVDNRMIYATDVYRVTLEFPEVDFLLTSFLFPIFFPFGIMMVMLPLVSCTDDYFISVVL